MSIKVVFSILLLFLFSFFGIFYSFSEQISYINEGPSDNLRISGAVIASPPSPEDGSIIDSYPTIKLLKENSESRAFIDFYSTQRSLVGYWNGENGEDSSTYQNDGELMNGVTFVPGKFGKAFNFDGVDDYVDLGLPPSLMVNKEVTLAAWINADPTSFYGNYLTPGILAWGPNRESSAFQFVWNDDNDALWISHQGCGWTGANIPGGIVRGTWQFVVMTYSQSEGNIVRLYIDGNLVKTQALPCTFPIDYAFPVKIGSAGGASFKGQIDEAMIFNRALRPEEVRGLYGSGSSELEVLFSGISPGSYNYEGYEILSTGELKSTAVNQISLSKNPEVLFTSPNPSNEQAIAKGNTVILKAKTNIDQPHSGFFDLSKSPNSPSLVAWFRGDGGADSSTYKNHGVFTGDIKIAPGKYGPGYGGFNGRFAIIVGGSSPSLNTPELTISTWVKSTNVGEQVLIDKRGAIGTSGYELALEGNSYPMNLVFKIKDGSKIDEGNGKETTNLYSNLVIPENEWTHITATFSSSSGIMSLYVNGILKDSRTTSRKLSSKFNTDALQIGAEFFTSGIDNPKTYYGSLDEIQIFNRVLNPEEIKALSGILGNEISTSFSNLALGRYDYAAYILAPTSTFVTERNAFTILNPEEVSGFIPPVCGNLKLEAEIGEECDDGNLISNDKCSSLCKIEPCGNQKIDLGEECDDGNLLNGDGCSRVCSIEISNIDFKCGDGIITGEKEWCDDGNLLNGDGCDSTCTPELDPLALLPQNLNSKVWPEAIVLRNAIKDLTIEDVTIPLDKRLLFNENWFLNPDGSYKSDELYRTWLTTGPVGDLLSEPLRLKPEYFTLNSIENKLDNQIMMSSPFSNLHLLAMWYNWDYLGNPYYHNEAVKNRILASLSTLIPLVYAQETFGTYTRSDTLAGQISVDAEAYLAIKDDLPREVQRAIESMLLYEFDLLRKNGPTLTHADIDLKALEGFIIIGDIIPHRKADAIAAVQKWLDLSFEDSRTIYYGHGTGPDMSYSGIARYGVLRAAIISGTDPNYQFLRDAANCMNELQRQVLIPDVDGVRYWSNTINSASTTDDFANAQWTRFQQILEGAILSEQPGAKCAHGGDYFLFRTGSEKTMIFGESIMIKQLSKRINEINQNELVGTLVDRSPSAWSGPNTWNSRLGSDAGMYYLPGTYAKLKKLREENSPVLLPSIYEANIRGEDMVYSTPGVPRKSQIVVQQYSGQKGFFAINSPIRRISWWWSNRQFQGIKSMLTFGIPHLTGPVIKASPGGGNDNLIWENWHQWPIHGLVGVAKGAKTNNLEVPFTSQRESKPAIRYVDVDSDGSQIEISGTIGKTNLGAQIGNTVADNLDIGGLDYNYYFKTDKNGVTITLNIESVLNNPLETVTHLAEHIPLFIGDPTSQDISKLKFSVEVRGDDWVWKDITGTTQIYKEISLLRVHRWNGYVYIELSEPHDVSLGELIQGNYQDKSQRYALKIHLIEDGIPTKISSPINLEYHIRSTETSGGLAQPDTMAPSLRDIMVVDLSKNTARIWWATTEMSTSKVVYDDEPISEEFLDELTSVNDLNLNYYHEMELTNLKPDTTYYFKILSTDASGNLVESGNNPNNQFRTLPLINLPKPICGNGIIEAGEECDTEGLNGKKCSQKCKVLLRSGCNIFFDKFSNREGTTNFCDSNLDISKIKPVLEHYESGKIEFLNDLDLSSVDSLDFDEIIISGRTVSLDPDSVGLSELHTASARITLYNLDVNSPLIKRDGIECTTCIIESYDKSSGTLIFTVEGFSEYTVEETATNTPSTLSSSSSGGGGGGEANSNKKISDLIPNLKSVSNEKELPGEKEDEGLISLGEGKGILDYSTDNKKIYLSLGIILIIVLLVIYYLFRKRPTTKLFFL